MRLILMSWLLLFAACLQPEVATPKPARSFPVPEIVTEKVRPLIELGGPTELPPQEPQALPEAHADLGPYSDWKSRCEPLDQARLCKKAVDCQGVQHPSGKPLKCIKPWWSDDAKVCSPGWSDRTERNWRRERLKTLVAKQYFPAHAQRKSKTLATFLWLVYQRETTGRPWKRHRLNGDIRASQRAWEAQADRYGHETLRRETTFRGRKSYQVVGAAILPTGNPHYAERSRWEFGLGPYGQVAPLWVATWDPQAPPEILCGEVESTETYLRVGRRVWRKLRGGIQCNGETYQPEVTWEILHRGVAGGKLCPGKSSEGFRRRAERLGLDPDQEVTLSMLGSPIGREHQNEVASELYAMLDETLPMPLPRAL